MREVKGWSEEELLELLQQHVMDERISFPTDCEEECEVEADGTCEHGGVSVLRKAGFV